uniref:Uncharacterized protein n=1 Tax=Daphnia galeata TaxID=27404 RepID=A0A8J2S0J4_9CRUS|nr:unnamed protein product [Daphnia galeata]
MPDSRVLFTGSIKSGFEDTSILEVVDQFVPMTGSKDALATNAGIRDSYNGLHNSGFPTRRHVFWLIKKYLWGPGHVICSASSHSASVGIPSSNSVPLTFGSNISAVNKTFD